MSKQLSGISREVQLFVCLFATLWSRWRWGMCLKWLLARWSCEPWTAPNRKNNSAGAPISLCILLRSKSNRPWRGVAEIRSPISEAAGGTHERVRAAWAILYRHRCEGAHLPARRLDVSTDALRMRGKVHEFHQELRETPLINDKRNSDAVKVYSYTTGNYKAC